ncbi:hypothetical protein, variant 3 [Exophiala mesophila]|uniref:Uncharacterized protein n=1 Tax=Exophiala mesophila TaxID=212818 RepID=A0A0D2A544_EXOME|nr:hypothetical protein, variant 3 [Exophiala mesophila]KIV94118.1 hypothetical protein, variant 3 [Exophiala mesophila]
MDPGLDSQQTSDESDEVAKTCKLLHATMKRMRTRDRLSGRSPRLVREAVDILKTPQTGRDNLVYQEFLCDVLHNCGRGVTLLCAASLGKFRVVRLQEKDKIGLIDHLKDNLINFQHSFLEALAKAHEIPSAYGQLELIFIHGNRLRCCRFSERGRKTSVYENPLPQNAKMADPFRHTAISYRRTQRGSHKVSARPFDRIPDPGNNRWEE